MLASLSIRNFVLIDRLDLEFDGGLCVMTGETGAGKSILLDALGLAIGARADASYARTAADDDARTSVTAAFELPDKHPVFDLLREHDIDPPEAGEAFVLRRTIAADGRSRGFVNDQPVSVAALRTIGETLVEIEGQFASHGMLDPANHRAALDAFGRLTDNVRDVRTAWSAMRDAESRLADARADIARIAEEGDYLRHVHAELVDMDPQPGEDASLSASRAMMMNSEKIVEAIEQAQAVLGGRDGLQTRLSKVMRGLERANEQAAGRLREALEALDRTTNEAATAGDLLNEVLRGIDQDPGRLEQLEERLFALRALARKHNTDVDSLAALRDAFAAKLDALDSADKDIAALEADAAQKRAAYETAALELSAARREAAARLDAAIAEELPSLRLEKARFATSIETSDATDGGPDGLDQIRFEVAANPGQPPGPVDRVASGGELARLLLALKVVLARTNRVDALVFDEVDAGVGGATAAAVADRLHRLAGEAQVLVVTHSPQVAARGNMHFRVRKDVAARNGRETTTTAISVLSNDERREEIARMLAGAKITEEARAAADSLIAEIAR
ncbi:MAG: DNA repair protein RecN [Alphaproteobacteria bacterium]